MAVGKAGSKLKKHTEKTDLVRMSDAHRTKIANSKVLSRLMDFSGTRLRPAISASHRFQIGAGFNYGYRGQKHRSFFGSV